MTKFVWKLEKLKSQNFKGCMFDGPVIVQLFHNLNLGFRSISQKILKDCHFVVDGSKNLKLSTNTCFGVSFQKNVLSSFLLFLSVCYQDDLSDSERNEIASSTARNFNKSWLLYVKFSETLKYLTDRKLKMSAVFIFEIKDAKKDKIFNFLKGRFFVMGALWIWFLACFQISMWGFQKV